MLYEMAARRMIVLEFHADDPSRIVMVCLAEMSDEALELAQLRAQMQELHNLVGSLRGQLQAAAPDSAAALQLAEEAESARQLTEDQLRETQRQLRDLQATIDEQIRLIQAAHPRVKDQRRIRELTHLLNVMKDALDYETREKNRYREEADSIPGYQEQIRRLTEEYDTLRKRWRAIELHRLYCGCVVGRTETAACTLVADGNHPWYPIVIPGVTDPQEGTAMLLSALTAIAADGHPTMVILTDNPHQQQE
jgi:chromosome segregation ATPase